MMLGTMRAMRLRPLALRREPLPLRAVRIGVVTHTLVAKKLKADQHTKREAAMPKNTHVQKDEYDDDLE